MIFLKEFLIKLVKSWEEEKPAPTPDTPASGDERAVNQTLARGSKGEEVRLLQERLRELGYMVEADGDFGPRTEEAVRSFQKSAGLDVDGVVGPATRAALFSSVEGDPPWLGWGRKEVGQKEWPGSAHNPRILYYHDHVEGGFKSELIAWCASFLCTALEETGFKSTNSAWARDFLNWGIKLQKYIYGCIGVYERNGPGGDSHVGIVVEQDGEYDLLLAGNQGNAVSIEKIHRDKLLGYRWPEEYPLPSATPQPTNEYERMFNSMVIRLDWRQKAEIKARKVLSGKNKYQEVSAQTRIPWHVIGLIHLMESECSFIKHLHNGDPLTERTVRVPKGRPTTGFPPFTWEESAKDAILYDKDKFQQPISNLGKQLESLERFNGLGYKKRGLPSPYLWSGSTYYTKGKFIRDGVYDPNAVSQQVGAAVVLKILREMNEV